MMTRKTLFTIICAAALCLSACRTVEEPPVPTEVIPTDMMTETEMSESGITASEPSETASDSTDISESTSEHGGEGTDETVSVTTVSVSEETAAQSDTTVSQSIQDDDEEKLFDLSSHENDEYIKGAMFNFGVAPIYKVNEEDYMIRYALMDKKGKLLTDFVFEQICAFSPEGIAAYKENDLWGFIDIHGNIICEPEYTDIGADLYGDCVTECTGGLYAVAQGERWGFINNKGETVIECKYHILSDEDKPRFVNGYARVYDDMFHAGYIDTYGKETTGFKYTYAGQFNRYGYAVVGKGDADEMKFGVINTRGDEIIPAEHDFVLPFADEKTGIAADLPEKPDDPISKYTLFSLSNGEQKPLDLGWRNKLRLTSPIDGDIVQEILSEHSLMIFETNSVIGLMDHEANVIVDARYENIYQIPKEKLPDDVICVFERYGKRCTLNDDYEINEYVTAKMMDPDPTQQILLELAGFEPIYTGTGEDVRFTQINKDGELFADLSSLDTPKAIATADGYLYIVGYEQNSDGGYTTIRKILDKNGRELNIPEHCVLSYNYLWGAY